MKKITFLLFMFMGLNLFYAQSTINISTFAGEFPEDKWVNITTEANGAGMQVWGQGGGTQCDGLGYINEDISIAPGTYYVNCYDVFDDSWDDTLISVIAYGVIIGNNGGLSPDDGADTDDPDFDCEGTLEELEASFMIVVPSAPSCVPPSDSVVSNLTVSSASFSWVDAQTSDSFDIEIVDITSGDTFSGVPTIENIMATSYMDNSLVDSNAYEFYIRSNCGGGDLSGWAGPVSFSTPCPPSDVPYSLDFEAGLTVPDCTLVANEGAGNEWIITDGNLSAGFTTNSLTYEWNGDSDANTWFFTAAVNLTAGTSYTISYNYGNIETTTTESLRVSYGTNPSAIEMTNELADYPVINQGEIQLDQVEFTPTTTGVYYFGFQAYSESNQFDLFVDNILVQLTPACADPLNLAVSNITNNSSSLSWNASASGNYEFVLDQNATAPMASGTALSTESYNATSLTENIQYYFHLRTDCGVDGFSEWITVSFVTLSNPPANDNCATAENIPLSAEGSENWIIGTTIGNTASGTSASCGENGSGRDTWFQVTIPSTIELGSNIIIKTQLNAGSSLNDTVMSVFPDCTGTNQIACDDQGGTDSFSQVTLTEGVNIAANDIVYVRINGFEASATKLGPLDGPFEIAATASNVTLSNPSFNNANRFNFYPNPINDTLNIENDKSIQSVSIFNIMGQKIKTFKPGINKVSLDLSELSSGAYFVNVNALNLNQTIRIIKK